MWVPHHQGFAFGFLSTIRFKPLLEILLFILYFICSFFPKHPSFMYICIYLYMCDNHDVNSSYIPEYNYITFCGPWKRTGTSLCEKPTIYFCSNNSLSLVTSLKAAIFRALNFYFPILCLIHGATHKYCWPIISVDSQFKYCMWYLAFQSTHSIPTAKGKKHIGIPSFLEESL